MPRPPTLMVRTRRGVWRPRIRVVARSTRRPARSASRRSVRTRQRRVLWRSALCDNGTPNLSATRSTTIVITAVNDPPSIISLTGGTAVEDQPFTVDATATDPDGPDAVWSLVSPTHTVWRHDQRGHRPGHFHARRPEPASGVHGGGPGLRQRNTQSVARPEPSPSRSPRSTTETTFGTRSCPCDTGLVTSVIDRLSAVATIVS